MAIIDRLIRWNNRRKLRKHIRWLKRNRILLDPSSDRRSWSKAYMDSLKV